MGIALPVIDPVPPGLIVPPIPSARRAGILEEPEPPECAMRLDAP
ncbi:hypothetical protein [Methylobacterium sp. J-026]|nr:hypothetical protein [Methylobacterium sp. J-026]